MTKDGFIDNEEGKLAKQIREIYPNLKPSGKGREGHRIERLLLKETGGGIPIDHYAVDGDCFIGEPYSPISMDYLKHLIAICERNNLTFDVSSKSWHFPFWSIRISIKKKD
jgi:hypothetical protein